MKEILVLENSGAALNKWFIRNFENMSGLSLVGEVNRAYDYFARQVLTLSETIAHVYAFADGPVPTEIFNIDKLKRPLFIEHGSILNNKQEEILLFRQKLDDDAFVIDLGDGLYQVNWGEACGFTLDAGLGMYVTRTLQRINSEFSTCLSKNALLCIGAEKVKLHQLENYTAKTAPFDGEVFLRFVIKKLNFAYEIDNQEVDMFEIVGIYTHLSSPIKNYILL